MTRCARCKNGQLPTPIRVTVMTVHVQGRKEYKVVLSCPEAGCLNPLSYTSARKLNHALVKIVEYE